MKRVIALLMCLALMVGVLAACGDDSSEACTHTYSEEWTKDANHHWYLNTCECDDAPIIKLAHVDKNNDKACDICEFTDHTHTYAEDYTVDCTNHWNAADCGCTVAGANVTAHADGDADGKCDTCAYVITDIHTHYYSTEWTTDEQYHWHAALCEHGVEVADKAAHNIDAAGYCTVCEEKIVEIDPTDIEAILAAAAARNDKIVDGNVTASQIVFDGSGSNMYVANAATNDVYYALGNGESYIFYKTFDMDGNFLGGEHQYFEQISEEEIFGVKMDVGTYELEVIAGYAQFLNGYTYFPGSILPSDSDDTTTLANTLSGIYALAVAGVNVDNFTESYDAETGVYSFSFSYFTVNSTTMSDGSVEHQVELYGVAAQFSVDENGVIDLAEFAVSSWRNWELDNDLDYDATTNTVTLRDTANPTIYTYSVSQRSGERTYTSIYPRASLVPVDFELSYVTGTATNDVGQMYITSEEPIVDTDEDGIVDITLAKDEYVRLHISELVPLTALPSALNVDDFEMTYVNKDAAGGELWRDADFLRPGFSGYMDCITFKVADAGEYTVTVRFGDVVKTLDVTVPAEQVDVVPDDTADTKYVQTTDTYTWDDTYTFTATESGTYTFAVPEGLGIWLEGSPQPEIDYYGAVGGNVTFKLAAGKSITFQVASTEKGIFAIGVSFVAGEVEGGDEGGEGGEGGQTGTIGDISGTYNAGGNTLVINSDGTMTFTYGSSTLNYTYEIDGNTVTYSLNGNAPYTADDGMAEYFGYLTFDSNGKPATFVYGGTSYTLTASTGDGETGGDEGDDNPPVVNPPAGTEGTVDDPHVLTEAGDYVCNFPGGWSPIWYSFTPAEDGMITVSSTFASGWIMIGQSEYEAQENSNGGDGSSVSYPVFAGETYLIGVGDYDEKIVDVPFTLAFVAGEVQPDGSAKLPFPVVLDEETVANVPDAPVWYTYTTTEGGYVTLYSAYQGVVLMVGLDTNNVTQNSYYDDNWNTVYTDNVKMYVPAGSTVYFGVGTTTYSAAEVPFTVSFEEVTSDPIDFLVGEWSGFESSYGSETPYTVTITADGLGYGVYGDERFSTTFDITFILVEGTKVTIGTITTGEYGGTTQNIEFTYDASAGTLTSDMGLMWGALTLAPATGSDDSDAPTYDANIVVGTNGIYFSPEEIAQDTADRTLVVEADGNYALACSDLFFKLFTAEGVEVTKTEGKYALTAGEYTVTFSMFSMLSTVADSKYTFTVTADVAQGGNTDAEAIVEGSNEIVFTADEIAQDTADRTLTVEADGNYELTCSDLFFKLFTAEGVEVTKTEGKYALTAGNYTVTFSMFSVLSVEADTAYTLNVTAEVVEDGGDEPEATITGDGSESTPYVISGAGTLQISADYYMPIWVQVKAGVTASLDCAAQFILEADGPVGMTVSPTVDTMYMICADNMAGCIGMLTATVSSADDGDVDTGISGEGAIDVTTLSGSGVKDDPYVITEAAVYSFIDVNAYPGVFVTITVTEATTVTITSDVSEIYSPSFGTKHAEENTPFVKELAAGESFSFTVVMETGNSDVLLSVEFE